ncbi:MAG: hypothetical protein MJZ20_03295 [Bacteroidaceae bacterium]|nr:hypothetical protein [Bacteroidaceae bacterium]
MGIRDYGEVVEQKTGYIDGFKFALYKDYSYTYTYNNVIMIKKSFSGNCAVVVGGYTDYSNIPSSVTYNNATYTVVAIGTGSQLNCHENLTIPNSVQVIECNAFNKTLSDSNNKLNSLTFADGDKDLYCFPLIEVIAKGGTFSGINTLK